MAKSRCRWESPEQFSEWSEWLSAGFDGRHQWRLPAVMIGMLLAGGRRTVTTWLRAAGVSDDYDAYYYFLARVGRKSGEVATRLVILLLRTLPLPDQLRTLRPNGHQDLQDLPGDLATGRGGDSSRVGEGGSWLLRHLPHRSRGECDGDPGSLRRPGDDRAGLPRRQGGLGIGTTTGPQYLDERRGLQFKLVDTYAGGDEVLGAGSRTVMRPRRLSLGRRRPPSVPRGSPQGLAPLGSATGINVHSIRLVAPAKNYRPGSTPCGDGRLRLARISHR